MRIKLVCATALLFSLGMGGETLGYIEQKFNSINFEKGKWARSEKGACYLYAAKQSDAQVEIMRFGSSNLVSFRASKEGLTVTVCADTAVFEEGFEARSKP